MPGLRPTPDRVRETLFNWLNHLLPDIQKVRGLDLFAGTGALGFELASRGARSVLLVEREASLVRNLLALRERLGVHQVEIQRADAFEAGRRLAACAFDVVFLDPPYASGLLPPALQMARTLLAPAGLIYAEAPQEIAADQLEQAKLVQIRHARAGRVHFYLLGLQQC
jgi:16S rRNA (guanine966-N2)-methyltransferase